LLGKAREVADDYFFLTRTPPFVAALRVYGANPDRDVRDGALWIFPECACATLTCFFSVRGGSTGSAHEFTATRRRGEAAVGGIGPHGDLAPRI
jgi:hypothetical protein